eukprot:tig00000076_g2404.t1
MAQPLRSVAGPSSGPSYAAPQAPQSVAFYQTSYQTGPDYTSSAYPPPAYSADNEPPLLEELGINPDLILRKTLALLKPSKSVDRTLTEDADMAGPLLLCLLLGFFLLLTGKVHFGYIYGLGACGCIGIYFVINLMDQQNSGVDLYRCTSILGYCLLPIVFLAFLTLIVPVMSAIGFVVSALSIGWATYMASGIFMESFNMKEQRILIAYPVGLFYTCFALITIF